jgi:hypothetical protein
MTRVLFAPFSILAGLIAGLVGKRLFEFTWGRIDEEEAPEPSHHDTSLQKVLVSAALQGLIFAVVRAATDRGARRAFLKLTGSWPGEEHRDEE